MKILVTGGAGFIGSNFVHYIIRKYPDYQLKVVDLLTYAGDEARLVDIKDHIEFHQADVSDYEAIDKLIDGVDVMVHFAAETHVDRSIADPGPFLKTNIIGTEVLVRLSLKHKIQRFHHVSTDEVFGTLPLDSEAMFNEDTPYDPRSPYSASKASSDHIVRAYGETYGLPYTITNCSNNYGPADSPGRIVSLFITNALLNQPLPIYGKGNFVRDYLFVYDHCVAIDLVLHSPKNKVTYCVGGGAQRTGVQVAESVLQALGKNRDLIQFVEDRPGHDPRYAIDHSKIKSELGWNPSVGFDEGVQKTVDWYKHNENWWRPYKQHLSLMREEGLHKGKYK